MKFILGTMVCILSFSGLFSQTKQHPSLSGTIVDEQTKKPIAGAVITIQNRSVTSGDDGHFLIRNLIPGKSSITVNSLGFEKYTNTINLAKEGTTLQIALKGYNLFLQPLEVKAIRAGSKAPFAVTNINEQEIAKTNLGQDIPFLLNQTPSVFVNSDAGNGIGYTDIHIRGTDATRINVTLNGIPYNDAESQGTYWVDLPDFASSLNSIQIQRGVGTSSNGTGAFGATINLSTNEFHEKPYAEVNNSYGSFNSWKNTLKVGSGLLNGHFTVDARLSKISSDGYIDRASSLLQSFALSTAYINKKTSIRFNIFSGKEKTYQAWYGVPDSLLATDRTYNPAGTEKPGTPYDNQTDNYQQDHYQLFFNQELNNNWSLNTALFMTYGRGYYEEYKAAQNFADYGLTPFTIGNTVLDSTDLIRRRWLNNHFYGQIGSLQYKTNKDELTFGGGWTRYEGNHFGNVIWAQYGLNTPNYQYYFYPAVKTDVNFYTKWQHNFAKYWYSFADVQYRTVSHTMNGFEGNGNLDISRKFNFVNPKAGITYSHNTWQAYFSYALGNKEPNRDDFQASLQEQPKAETLHDFEMGVSKKNSRFNYSADLYYMLYKNQLVLTGIINDVGAYTRINVPNSYRMGIELQGAYIFSKWINAQANFSLSRNKIKSFTEYIDNYDTGGQNAVQHTNTDISFSPDMIGAATINIIPEKNITLSFLSKYVSKQYMDNTQNEARSLAGFFTETFRANYTVKNFVFKEWNFILQINNIFNKLYEPNGYTYSYISNNHLYTDNNYFPMAGTNYMLAVNISL
jgi:iron complex outermembrane receptor protein